MDANNLDNNKVSIALSFVECQIETKDNYKVMLLWESYKCQKA